MHARGFGVEMLLLPCEAAGNERYAQNQQQIPDDRAYQRRLDHVKIARQHQQHRNDQLGDVAERGVEQATEPGTDTDGQLVGGAPDQARQRHDGQTRGDEDQ